MIFLRPLSVLVAMSAVFTLAQTLAALQPPVSDPRPNVIIILTDDQGWSDVGFNGCREIPTPHIDRISATGVTFKAGYVTHPYCSPSRAGLMTGRYQQRFGHECNPIARATDGLPLTETLLPQLFLQAGYRTAMIGKWHLGDDDRFWPTRRGFDEWFGFAGGGMSYWGDLGKKDTLDGILKNEQPVPKSQLTYLTDDFSSAAVDFIESQRNGPFFLYLAYNAPHSPDQATRESLQKMSHIEYGDRAVYGAMVSAVDDGVGRILATLDAHQLTNNTLHVFLSDNGGRAELARNFPFRGHKGMLFEGGIRVPFCVSWPAKLPSGMTYEHPVSALDLFPTTLAAAGISVPKELSLHGINLIPFLTGQLDSRPHETLFWRYATAPGEYGYAVRHGDWKLVESQYKKRSLLFDLANDPYEIDDLSETHPDRVRELSQRIREWDKENIAPLWIDPHGENVAKEEQARAKAVEAASRGQKKKSAP